MVDWKVLCVGIFCLTALEICALFNGVNGTMFTLIVAIIAGTIGYTIPILRK